LNSPHFIEILLIFSGIASLAYPVLLFITIIFHKENFANQELSTKGVSIIIAAHNELTNLQSFLPLILAQNYPLFEVIIACDRCNDGSTEYLHSLNHPHLKVIEIHETTEGFNPKKYALDRAIAQSSYPWLLLTDADCYPASEQWIKGMMQGKSLKKIVIGLSFYKGPKSFLNRFIAFETLFTAMQYSAWTILGKPYMAVGRNLLYAKELFINNSGFGKYASHLGGDDDLLLQSISDKTNTTVCFNPSTFTYTPPPKGFKAWWKQKHRHLNAGKQYPLAVLAGLSFYPFFSIVYYAISLVYINSLEIPIVIVLYILRTCIFIITFAGVSQKWKISIFWPLLPVLEIYYLFYLMFAGLYNLAVPIKKWK